MNKFYEIWEPVLRNFKKAYENWCIQQNLECAEVLDWYPSAHMEITVKLSDDTTMVYEFIGDKCYEVKNTNAVMYSDKRITDSEIKWRKNFADRLWKKMNKSGIGRDRLSELTGISTVTLSKYLNARATPSAFNLERISNVLKCSVSELTSVRGGM